MTSRRPRTTPTTGDQPALEGRTIFRFSHAFEHGGGLEQYIDDLNGILSSRQCLHTVQLRLTKEVEKKTVATFGASRVTTYFVPARAYVSNEESHTPSRVSRYRQQLRDSVRDQLLYNPLLYSVLTHRWLNARAAAVGQCDPEVVLGAVERILREEKPEIAIMHSAGDRDCQLVQQRLLAERIPTGLVHHFANDRLRHSAMREQVRLAHRVGAVSVTDLPPYVRPKFDYLGDGVDTEFLAAAKATAVGLDFPGPRVFLPARLIRSKGHLDLIRAAGIAKARGVSLHLYFAGRCDSESYRDEIQAEGSRLGISGQIHLLGPLNREQLRNWYCSSTVTALPSHHHEGLPRVLLESQALGVPPVAYDIGGVREGFINGKTGLLVRIGDVNSLAESLMRVVEDPAERVAMGRAGRELVENTFSFSALARRHEEFAVKLLGGYTST